jgi:preprotein translocase subunit SecB
MAEAQQDPQPVFTIEKIYVKDLSLEVPNAPQIFLERDTPRVDVQLSTKATPIDDGHYEVVLSVTTTAS